jgi:hypothetical protein
MMKVLTTRLPTRTKHLNQNNEGAIFSSYSKGCSLNYE